MFFIFDEIEHGTDFRHDAATGKIDGVTAVALNPTNFILGANAEADICAHGGDLSFNLTNDAKEFDLISTLEDNSAGTGTRLVLVTFMNTSNVIETQFVVTTAGTVQITGSYKFVITAIGVDSGTLHFNQNNIDIVNRAAPAEVHLRMLPNTNNAFSCMHPVPEKVVARTWKVSGWTGANEELIIKPYLRQVSGNIISGQEIPVTGNFFSVDLWTPTAALPGEVIFFRVQRIGGGGLAKLSMIVEMTHEVT